MTATHIDQSPVDSGGFTHLYLAKPEGYEFKPGQYARLLFADETKEKYLAIASHTSEMALHFVLRSNYPPGTPVKISAPQGAGFTCDFGDARAMLFLTHGTGISALRPAMLERRSRGFREDALLYGIQHAEAEPELDCLRPDFGVRQWRAYSQSDLRKYVQHEADRLALNHFGAILLVGSKEMMESCRVVLLAKAYPENRIFSNF